MISELQIVKPRMCCHSQSLKVDKLEYFTTWLSIQAESKTLSLFVFFFNKMRIYVAMALKVDLICTDSSA